MVDADTFLTALYVVVDDFCKAHLPPAPPPPCPGPAAALSRGELLTLAIFGRWQGFGSERGFYRYAERHLRGAFPALPAREQFNRQLRRHGGALMACVPHLGGLLQARRAPYEALDTAAVPTRDAKRRGAGWLPGLTDIGWSNRLGWFEGVRLLLAVTPAGVITGFGIGPGRAKDQPLAETFFALRRHPYRRAGSVGAPAAGPSITDKGFEGRERHRRWAQEYGAVVITGFGIGPGRAKDQPLAETSFALRPATPIAALAASAPRPPAPPSPTRGSRAGSAIGAGRRSTGRW